LLSALDEREMLFWLFIGTLRSGGPCLK
jgi:hypothetical protein